MEEEGHWLDITEYTQYRNISISTARRYIKAKRVKFKKDDGKYLIFVSKDNYQKKNKGRDDLKNSFELQRLKEEMRLLKEENIELKMLISIYENDLENKHMSNEDQNKITPPSIPHN